MKKALLISATNVAGEIVVVNTATRRVVGRDCHDLILARVCLNGVAYPVDADGNF